MACYKVTVIVIDSSPSPGEAGKSWKYTFYTRKDPETDPALLRGMSDPLSIVSDTTTSKKVRGFKQCRITVKEYAKNGSWTVSYDPDPNNSDSFKRPSVPYGALPPWGGIDVTYQSSSDPVDDNTCDEDFTTQEIDDGDYFPDTSTECGCEGSGDSGLADFSGGGFGGLSHSFNAQSTPTMKDFVDYIESLQSSCLSNGGAGFTLQFACLPKNIILSPFTLPDDWNNYGDAQKSAFLDSKATMLQSALGRNYYQQISLTAKCLKSSGSVVNGCIYKQ